MYAPSRPVEAGRENFSKPTPRVYTRLEIGGEETRIEQPDPQGGSKSYLGPTAFPVCIYSRVLYMDFAPAASETCNPERLLNENAANRSGKA
jgi:hypothetical protein